MARSNPPKPEHREINLSDADVVNLGRAGLELECTECRPFTTAPCRYKDDPESVVRCAQCGKKHSTENLNAL